MFNNQRGVYHLEIVALVVAVLFFLAGFIGTLFPVLPGAPMIWAGMLLYGLIYSFDKLDLTFFVLQGMLALAVMGVDYLATALGSRYFGGSKAAIWGAVLGLLAGLLFLPIGLLIGPFMGAVLLELLFTRKTAQSIRSGLGAALGFWCGFAVKLSIEAGMIFWFIKRVI